MKGLLLSDVDGEWGLPVELRGKTIGEIAAMDTATLMQLEGIGRKKASALIARCQFYLTKEGRMAAAEVAERLAKYDPKGIGLWDQKRVNEAIKCLEGWLREYEKDIKWAEGQKAKAERILAAIKPLAGSDTVP
jgi:DNA uptake protein ComE-like DNA-binding protein